MSLRHLIDVFWLAELALEPLLLFVLIATQLWRKFPFFAAFSMWSIVGDTTSFLALHYVASKRLVAASVFINETVSVILAAALTYEIFMHLVASHQALRRLATLCMQFVSVCLVLLGVAVLLLNGPLGNKSIGAAVLVVQESYLVLQVGLIFALFLFASAFGLHWRRQVFGIALGLGLSASLKLAVVAIHPHSYVVAGILNAAVMASYVVGLLIWILYLLVPERVADGGYLPQPSQLEQWNRAVMELIHQ